MKYLIINGDDFASSEGANRGILRGFQEGLLTSASLMVPCAWFPHAAALAKEHKLNCALHVTLTCEYHHYQFGPLTRAPRLSRDGKGHTFYLSANDIPKDAGDDVYREIEAQMERCLDYGVTPTHVDAHMGALPRWDDAFLAAADKLYEKFRIPFLRAKDHAKSLPLATVDGLGKGDKGVPFKQRVRAQLETLSEGVTYLIAHPAILTSEMKAMELRDGFAQARQDDLDVILDPEVRGWLKELGIEMISVKDACKLVR